MEIDGRGISPESTAPVPSAVLAALEDDLNTPLAIAHLHDLADAVFRSEDARERHRLIAELTAGVELMGLLSADRRMRADESFLARIGEISARVDERSVARRNRDFAKADRIRAELATEGIVLEDKSDGRTTWRWKE
jgi:cysteinyl-tRNA synthetase